MNLRSRIQLTVIGLLLVALLPTISLLTWTARQSLLEHAQEDGKRIAQLVQVSYHIDFAENLRQQVGVEPLVEQLIQGQQVTAVWVVNLELTPMATGVTTQAGISTEITMLDQTRLRAVIDQQQIYSHIEARFLKVYTPLIGSQGEIKGATLIYLSLDAVRRVLRSQLTLAVGITLVVLSLGLVASYLLSRWIIDPIQRVSTASAALAAGNWKQDLPAINRSDELGVMARSFSHMAQQIKKSFETLEDKVKERTAALAKASDAIHHLSEQLKAENVRLGAEVNVARQIQQLISPKPEKLNNFETLDIDGSMEAADADDG